MKSLIVKINNLQYYLKIRLLFGVIFIFIIIFLLWMKIVPMGTITYTYNFKNNNDFISRITPKSRVLEIKDGSQKIVGNPVYFTLRTPRKFKTAILNLEYKNNKYPIIEAGILVDNTLWRYNLKSVKNSIIDDLAYKWNVVHSDDVFLIQRNNDFLSLDEFFNAKIDYGKIAVYDYDLKTEFKLNNYTPTSTKRILNYGLRGDFQFFTYIKNELLSFDFNIQDLNQNKSKDDININLYYQNQIINTAHLDDDGNIKDNGVVSSKRNIKIDANGLPEGVYKVEMRVDDDIIVNSIETAQQKIAFLNKIRLNNKTDIKTIYTDTNQINVKTINPASLQNIKFDNKNIEINKTYKQFSANMDFGISKVVLEKNDLMIGGDGIFAFNKSDFFNPRITKINKDTDINKQGIDYILTKYKPTKNKEWENSTVSFNLEKAYNENNKYSFIISVPGLKIEDKKNSFIEIKKISIMLKD